MRCWMIFVQEEGCATWLEAAWDDESTSENPRGWDAEVERVNQMCAENACYSMRILYVTVPGVHDAFEIPKVTAAVAPRESGLTKETNDG